MTTFTAFSPATNASISVTNAGTDRAAIPGIGAVILVQNVGSTECFVKLGTNNTVTAAVTDFSVPGNTSRFLAVNDAITNVAAVTAAGTTTLRIARGEGGV